MDSTFDVLAFQVISFEPRFDCPNWIETLGLIIAKTGQHLFEYLKLYIMHKDTYIFNTMYLRIFYWETRQKFLNEAEAQCFAKIFANCLQKQEMLKELHFAVTKRYLKGKKLSFSFDLKCRFPKYDEKMQSFCHKLDLKKKTGSIFRINNILWIVHWFYFCQ